LERHEVERLFSEHRSGAADHARILYAVLMFSIWWDTIRSSRAMSVGLQSA
jgi:asparagine synthase (glutamine-hydrolysing)